MYLFSTWGGFNKTPTRWFKPWPFCLRTLEVTKTFETVTYPSQKGHPAKNSGTSKGREPIRYKNMIGQLTGPWKTDISYKLEYQSLCREKWHGLELLARLYKLFHLITLLHGQRENGPSWKRYLDVSPVEWRDFNCLSLWEETNPLRLL